MIPKIRKEIIILARSKDTGEVYKKIFQKYMEVDKWAEKHDMEVFSVDIKIKKIRER